MAQSTSSSRDRGVAAAGRRGAAMECGLCALRRDPHCFGSKITSTYSIDLIFNTITSAKTISETMVTVLKPNSAAETPGFFSAQVQPWASWW